MNVMILTELANIRKVVETIADGQSELTLIREAAERIADATERQAAADPLAMLQDMAERDVLDMRMDERQPIAGNGLTLVYAIPGTDDWHIVARRDSVEESGYTVTVERA